MLGSGRWPAAYEKNTYMPPGAPLDSVHSTSERKGEGAERERERERERDMEDGVRLSEREQRRPFSQRGCCSAKKPNGPWRRRRRIYAAGSERAEQGKDFFSET